MKYFARALKASAYIAVALLLGLTYYLYFPPDYCTDSSFAKKRAFGYAKEQVLDALTSPSTAVFPDYSDRGVSILKVDRCKFSIRAHVDSQNGFGAVIRSKFSVEVMPDSEFGIFTYRKLSVY